MANCCGRFVEQNFLSLIVCIFIYYGEETLGQKEQKNEDKVWSHLRLFRDEWVFPPRIPLSHSIPHPVSFSSRTLVQTFAW